MKEWPKLACHQGCPSPTSAVLVAVGERGRTVVAGTRGELTFALPPPRKSGVREVRFGAMTNVSSVGHWQRVDDDQQEIALGLQFLSREASSPDDDLRRHRGVDLAEVRVGTGLIEREAERLPSLR